jgi:hypothetical protein
LIDLLEWIRPGFTCVYCCQNTFHSHSYKQPCRQLCSARSAFMPYISGFIRFVTTIEIEHVQSIIKEVLEVLIKSNQLAWK